MCFKNIKMSLRNKKIEVESLLNYFNEGLNVS